VTLSRSCKSLHPSHHGSNKIYSRFYGTIIPSFLRSLFGQLTEREPNKDRIKTAQKTAIKAAW
jgi:hypothetical protein